MEGVVRAIEGWKSWNLVMTGERGEGVVFLVCWDGNR